MAAAVTAFAVVTSQDTPKADDPGPLTSPTVVEPTPTSGLRATAVYYVGDTPFGDRGSTGSSSSWAAGEPPSGRRL